MHDITFNITYRMRLYFTKIPLTPERLVCKFIHCLLKLYVQIFKWLRALNINKYKNEFSFFFVFGNI